MCQELLLPASYQSLCRTWYHETIAFFLHMLDYCNSLLFGWPKSVIATLQRVQNAAARMFYNLHPCDNISNGLRHWLPIESRIQLKLCLLVPSSHTGQCPLYIVYMAVEIVLLTSNHFTRSTVTSGFRSVDPKCWNCISAVTALYLTDLLDSSRSLIAWGDIGVSRFEND